MTVDTDRRTGTSASSREQPNGPAWASILAAGIGCASFGIVTDLAECSARVNGALEWYRPAGGLSGVAGCALIIRLGTWALSNARCQRRHFASAHGVMAVPPVLVFIGLLATFPPFVGCPSRSHDATSGCQRIKVMRRRLCIPVSAVSMLIAVAGLSAV